MKKEKKDRDFIKSPYFEGGRSALDAFVKKELRYPAQALEARIEGTVSLRYTVDYKGHISDVMVISGLGYGCDEEAVRVVRSLQFRVPEDGRIKSKYSRKIHIHFRLPGSPENLPATKKIKTPPSALQIQYQITGTATTPKPAASKPSYTISITLPDTKKKT